MLLAHFATGDVVEGEVSIDAGHPPRYGLEHQGLCPGGNALPASALGWKQQALLQGIVLCWRAQLTLREWGEPEHQLLG